MSSGDSNNAGTIQVPRSAGASRSDYQTLLLSDTPLLDVRAPVEFTKGAFPESVNFPLMNDEERHLVGIRYKEAGQDQAIELGAKLVNPEIRKRRVEAWKKFAEQHPDAALYCFRGGLRSRISQQWLKEAGVDMPLITGGYKALRTFLIETLQELCASLRMTLVGGRTGNGKTLLLKRLGDFVDLEKLAHHRGSSFGGLEIAQPSNIDFENAVTVALMRLELAGCDHLYLEDEARLIGRVCVPDTLRNTLQSAPIIILESPMEDRIQNCYEDYVPELLSRYISKLGREEGFTAFKEHHRSSLAKIKKRFGLENYQVALELLNTAMDKHENHEDDSAYSEFIEMLLRQYYDPMYDYQLSKKQQRIIFKGSADEIINWENNRE